MGGVGYTLPFKKTALSFEVEFEYANRNGTIDGKGDASYQSGQIGGNIIYHSKLTENGKSNSPY